LQAFDSFPAAWQETDMPMTYIESDSEEPRLAMRRHREVSLEGWATSASEPSFETPRKRAAPQDDAGCVAITAGRGGSDPAASCCFEGSINRHSGTGVME
jgi:hypothetical protein